MNKLNFGVANYKKGFVNLDFNRNIKADMYRDLDNLPLPFPNNFFDYAIVNNMLQHVKKDMFFKFMDEIIRVCKVGTIIDVWATHYTSIGAVKYACHDTMFGINSFIFFTEEVNNGENYSDGRLEVLDQKLYFAEHKTPFFLYKIINKFNPIFNLFGNKWKQLMERFQVFGFDEIRYKLRVVD